MGNDREVVELSLQSESQAMVHLGVVFEGGHEQGKHGRQEKIEAGNKGTFAGRGKRDAPLLEP